MTSSTHDSHGSGPGVITPDGCAVDLYSLLPPGRDPELIHGAIPPGASVLEWFDVVAPSERTVDGITYRLRDVSRPGPGLLSATAEYQVGDRVWAHSFTTARVGDADLAADLAATDLTLDAVLTEDQTWIRAVPRRR